MEASNDVAITGTGMLNFILFSAVVALGIIGVGRFAPTAPHTRNRIIASALAVWLLALAIVLWRTGAL